MKHKTYAVYVGPLLVQEITSPDGPVSIRWQGDDGQWYTAKLYPDGGHLRQPKRSGFPSKKDAWSWIYDQWVDDCQPSTTYEEWKDAP